MCVPTSMCMYAYLSPPLFGGQAVPGCRRRGGGVCRDPGCSRRASWFVSYTQKQLNTQLKTDHPERPTMTLGWSLAYPRSITDAPH